jgi:hypothetical protein
MTNGNGGIVFHGFGTFAGFSGSKKIITGLQLPRTRKAAQFSNYRILTPCYPAVFGRFQLPVFDAAKTGVEIQEAVVKIAPKSRRRKPVVRFFANQMGDFLLSS